jgi:NIPSNAP
MIFEIRTYRVKTGSVPEVEKRFGEAYEIRKKHSELAAFWHTEIGPLNEIVHVWPYQNLEERGRIRAAAAKETGWPPKLGDFVTDMQSEVLVPFAFSPTLPPGKHGPFYELRYYTLKPGTLPDLVEGWASKIAERTKLSPLALAGNVDIGEANRFIHIWPYRSLDERAAIRKQARDTGVWPPPGGGDTVLTQANKILMPAAFSPAQ